MPSSRFPYCPLPNLIVESLICIVTILPVDSESRGQAWNFPVDLPHDLFPEHRDHIVAAIGHHFLSPADMSAEGVDSLNLFPSSVTLVDSFLSCDVC